MGKRTKKGKSAVTSEQNASTAAVNGVNTKDATKMAPAPETIATPSEAPVISPTQSTTSPVVNGINKDQSAGETSSATSTSARPASGKKTAKDAGRRAVSAKKDSSQKAKSAKAEVGIPRQTKREIIEMVNRLLDLCTQPFSTGAQEWADFLEVYKLVQKIREKQKGYTLQLPKREEHFGEFLTWLHEHGVDTSAVSIEKFPNEGYGLKAERNLEVSEKFLSIPRKVMLSTETAQASLLGNLIKQDQILQAMSNVVLSLHILCEYMNPDSFWAPYIKILPDTYTTPLYFTSEDIALLKGSPLFSDVLNQHRNIARQYAYFYRLFQINPEGAKLPIKDFCYDDYRWAVSTVMTRQNQIPSSVDESHTTLAMIPLWDMCNHTEGMITTDFNLEKDTSECYAVNVFKKDEQVYIYYGERCNADLILHNGFLYPGNRNDKMMLKMGVSKNDPTYTLKAELLARLTMVPNRIFDLHVGDEPVSSDVLAFLRIFMMSEETLNRYLRSPSSFKKAGTLRDFGEIVNAQNEVEAWKYIETRVMLLQRSYQTTIEDDKKLLAGESLSDAARMSVQLRLIEKEILRNTEEYSKKARVLFEAQLAKIAMLKATAENDEDIDAQMAQIELA